MGYNQQLRPMQKTASIELWVVNISLAVFSLGRLKKQTEKRIKSQNRYMLALGGCNPFHPISVTFGLWDVPVNIISFVQFIFISKLVSDVRRVGFGLFALTSRKVLTTVRHVMVVSIDLYKMSTFRTISLSLTKCFIIRRLIETVTRIK